MSMVCTHSVCVKGLYVQSSSSSNSSLNHGVIIVAGRIGLDHGVIAVAGRTGLEPQSTGQCSGFVHGPMCPWFVRTVSVLKACTHSREDWA